MEHHHGHHGNQTGYDISEKFPFFFHHSPMTSANSDKKVLKGDDSVQIYDVPFEPLLKKLATPQRIELRMLSLHFEML